ncbi:competence protein ComK [Neobacillus mesonae]|uniref:competence protein ComK n=1 Tax=Neobacillus mesonae TaxID=1193713 RepID=UPI002E1BA9AD|nr:competence protein ComK [Neobacillus mesonae]MED4206660.1 competence protein ComK [Neobacillus mesonae]
MLSQPSYMIDEMMILMTGEYDQYGKLCTRVMDGAAAFLVDRTPLQLLDDTLTYIGFDLRGAMSSAKLILGKKMKYPVIVNPYLGVCLFPVNSPHKADCIWFNPEHIMKTTAAGNKTKVELSNGYYIMVDLKLYYFNNKIQTARQLMRISKERGTHPNGPTFLLQPKKEQQLAKEKTGKYNFHSLERKQD